MRENKLRKSRNLGVFDEKNKPRESRNLRDFDEKK